MINIIKGILYRMINNKSYLIMPIVITPIIIAISIYFSSSLVAKYNIGVIGDYSANFNSDEVNITRLENKVPLSDLVKNKYEAVISFKNGKVIVDTIKGNDFKSKIERLVNGERITNEDSEKRGVVSNIVGFITMFIIALGVLLYRFFFDDKKGISRRIISTNITYVQYILSHFISVFLMIFVPTVTITILSRVMLDLDTRVTSVELILIIFVLSLFSSAFGLLMSTVTKQMQSASMLGMMINVITTLLSGSFFTISNNKLVSLFGSIMPQRHILEYTISLENGKFSNYTDIASVILISIVMIISSFLIIKYKMRKYSFI
ncbi:ABC transporter permease [Clostridium chromiireducens]|uniref:ABC transporter permease n=1 Tax=Clostridium chromiireducens TaxID=225345 RepID=UPI003AF9D45E